MPSIETRIQKLETVLPPDERYPIAIVQAKPWCSSGRHPLPYGYLRGYGNWGLGGIQREPDESEEAFKERAVETVKKSRGAGCGIVLVEDRELVECDRPECKAKRSAQEGSHGNNGALSHVERC